MFENKKYHLSDYIILQMSNLFIQRFIGTITLYIYICIYVN